MTTSVITCTIVCKEIHAIIVGDVVNPGRFNVSLYMPVICLKRTVLLIIHFDVHRNTAKTKMGLTYDVVVKLTTLV